MCGVERLQFIFFTILAFKFLENGNGEGKGEPMACTMVYWGTDYDKFFEVFLKFGAVVDLRELFGKAIGDKSTLRQPSLFHDEVRLTKN